MSTGRWFCSRQHALQAQEAGRSLDRVLMAPTIILAFRALAADDVD